VIKRPENKLFLAVRPFYTCTQLRQPSGLLRCTIVIKWPSNTRLARESVGRIGACGSVERRTVNFIHGYLSALVQLSQIQTTTATIFELRVVIEKRDKEGRRERRNEQ